MAPTLEDANGRPVDVTPPGAEDINARFDAAMNDDGPDEAALPKRQPKPAAEAEAPKPRRGRPPKDEKSRTVAKTAVALDDSARAAGVKGLAQIGAGLVLMAGKATGNDAFQADAITIASKAGELADACVQTAHADPVFAARLDRICSAGPYAALITVMVGIGSQCVRNHKPAAAIPGTVHPAELLAAAGPVPAAV